MATSEHSTASYGEVESTSSQADFRVRALAPLVDELASQILAVVSSPKCSGSSLRLFRRSSSQKTLPGFEGLGSMSSRAPWPASGMLSRGSLLELDTSALRTRGIGCGFSLPTPQASDNCGTQGSSLPGRTTRPSLLAILYRGARLPTPTASMSRHGWGFGRHTKLRYSQEVIDRALELSRGHWRPTLATLEWLMCWPIGWSAREPLATAKFRSWLQSHGVSCAPW